MFKKTIFYVTLLTIYGCDSLGSLSSSVISNSPTSSTANTSSECPEQPKVTLKANDVKEITLNEQTVTISAQASANKAIGYTFIANSGDKLNYQTNENLCIWVYSPDNQIITGSTLPKEGKYTMQITALQGSKTFDLDMSLGELQVSTPPPVTPTNNDTPEDTSSDNSNNSNTINTNITTSSVNDLSQEEALSLVARWYEAKPRIFAPPFDRSLLGQLSTGKMYQDVNGSIEWLQKYNRYYTYNRSEITNVIDFSNYGSNPYIKVRVVEELYLHGEKGIDRKASGRYQLNYIYFFTKENGDWKLYSKAKI
ncbi:MAG: DUF4101 domain-containing protein [Nostocales cyanobacterium]|nr:MAG: DUF4101 domain-containing protein [Nostocales cyanobacterium]